MWPCTPAWGCPIAEFSPGEVTTCLLCQPQHGSHISLRPAALTRFFGITDMRRAITQFLALLAVLSLAGVQAQMLGASRELIFSSNWPCEGVETKGSPAGQPCASVGNPLPWAGLPSPRRQAWVFTLHSGCRGAAGRPHRKN